MEDLNRASLQAPLNVLQSVSSNFSFSDTLLSHGLWPLRRDRVSTLQVNVGKLCNQACLHCHVEAGPKRTESMPEEVVERTLRLLSASPAIDTVDITGGAPELNPNFHRLVMRSRELGRAVIDRCNLTVLFEPGMEPIADFLAAHQVEIRASLPCYTAANVDSQRGRGAFEKSIRALQHLNKLGYGRPNSALKLNLVYNPLGASLPADQSSLEADYKRELNQAYSIEFHQLFTLANMPIRRFADFLDRSGQSAQYMNLLREHFNPAIVPGVMCRSLVSVGWDGALYDCDFNQMLEIGINERSLTVWDLESFSDLPGEHIATGSHCFGCTAGAGSSCGGALQ